MRTAIRTSGRSTSTPVSTSGMAMRLRIQASSAGMLAGATLVVSTMCACSSITFRRALEERRDVEVQPRTTSGLREWLRHIDTEARDSDVIAPADADRVLEHRVTEAVERVTDVEECRGAEIARQQPLDLDRCRGEVFTADGIAIGIAWRQLIEAEAANAAVTTGEESLRGGQVAEVSDPARAELGAKSQIPHLAQVIDSLTLRAKLQERGVGTERARRASQFRVEIVGTRASPRDVTWQRCEADTRDDQERVVLV